MKISWAYIWLPNVTYLQLGLRNLIVRLYDNAGDASVGQFSDPPALYTMVLFGQFLAWLLVYLILDRFVSTDTGTKKVLIGTASDTLADYNKSMIQDSTNRLLENHSANGI